MEQAARNYMFYSMVAVKHKPVLRLLESYVATLSNGKLDSTMVSNEKFLHTVNESLGDEVSGFQWSMVNPVCPFGQPVSGTGENCDTPSYTSAIPEI